MINPLKYIVRCLVFRRDKSTVPHGILPLGKVSCATVLVDSSAADADATCKSVSIRHHFCRVFEAFLSGNPVSCFRDGNVYFAD